MSTSHAAAAHSHARARTDTTNTEGSAEQDALALLRADHALIRASIDERMDATPRRIGGRRAFVARLGALLRVHARIEDEIFYPALMAHAGPAAVQHAMADHAEIATRLEAVAEADPASPDFDRRMAVLARAVESHFKEEEATLFAAAEGLDLAALGRQLALRRATLLGDVMVD